MTAIGALLSQKPSTPAPQVGQTQNYTIEERPKKSGEGTWKKAKREGAGFGAVYKILKAEPLEDYTNEHGTLKQWSLMLELAEGNAQQAVGGSGTASAASNGAGGGDARDESIARAVSFKGAVEIVAAHIQQGKLAPEAATGAITTLTEALLPIVKGNTTPPTPPAPSGDNLTTDAGEEVPF